MEEREVLVAENDVDTELVVERDLVLIWPACFTILALNENIVTFDLKSSIELSRMEAHSISQLILRW